MRILVMGATGYLGGRLVPMLLDAGHEVRCLSRSPEKLRDIDWAARVEIARGDALDPESLRAAMVDVDVVYYLVHSIGSGRDFEATDRAAARHTSAAAAESGVQRIVYLGGLVPDDERTSPHLASRAEVGQILLDGPVPAVVLQAGVIIGSGSASFEMLRYLTERLPVMVTPRWVDSRIQPIAVRDVLGYLTGALSLPPEINRRYDIAGPEVLTYREMMLRYAHIAGLRRIIVPVPLLTPRLSSHWVNLVTPVPRSIAAPLIESLRNSVVAHEHDLQDRLGIEPTGFDRAVELALARIRNAEVPTRWSGASWPGAPSDPMPTDPDWSGGTAYRDERCVTAPTGTGADDLWRVVEGIGGERGWYSPALAWEVRGIADRLLGGVGLRRGRRDPDRLHVGEVVDFWRVEALDRNHLLRLRAEMRLPGEAWLEFRIEQNEAGRPVLQQNALFLPRGLLGHLYWWGVTPFHGIVFQSMATRLVAAAAPGER